jgi:hypothetical protein
LKVSGGTNQVVGHDEDFKGAWSNVMMKNFGLQKQFHSLQNYLKR